jgi:hypothetical protein
VQDWAFSLLSKSPTRSYSSCFFPDAGRGRGCPEQRRRRVGGQGAEEERQEGGAQAEEDEAEAGGRRPGIHFMNLDFGQNGQIYYLEKWLKFIKKLYLGQ